MVNDTCKTLKKHNKTWALTKTMGLSDLFALFVCYTVVCDHWFFNPSITTPKRNIDELHGFILFRHYIWTDSRLYEKKCLTPLRETLTSNLPGFCGELLWWPTGRKGCYHCWPRCAPPSSSRPLLPRRSYRFIARVRGSFETSEVFSSRKVQGGLKTRRNLR